MKYKDMISNEEAVFESKIPITGTENKSGIKKYFFKIDGTHYEASGKTYKDVVKSIARRAKVSPEKVRSKCYKIIWK